MKLTDHNFLGLTIEDAPREARHGTWHAGATR
jgi:hypothetical protein